ncbi:helix-turn-helix transcriptional regulator [uncultured Draconibacterium sp.]|uniref:helix-turn-helix domain-containing protein n=1 Tax=uncultured Draconibacterium sp. TaxID=1573823 RepID=UPI00326131EE
MKDRIKRFIDAKGITAGELASALDVQRSNISHILNGRNKPGASFIEKLLLQYPDINARWLLTGQGEMFSAPYSTNNLTENSSTKQKEEVAEVSESDNSNFSLNFLGENKTIKTTPEQAPSKLNNDIDKMIIVYCDGTFKIFSQR